MKKLHLICNSHIDPVWQWDWNEGLGTAISTFWQAVKFHEENLIFITHDGYLYYIYDPKYKHWRKHQSAAPGPGLDAGGAGAAGWQESFHRGKRPAAAEAARGHAVCAGDRSHHLRPRPGPPFRQRCRRPAHPLREDYRQRTFRPGGRAAGGGAKRWRQNQGGRKEACQGALQRP